MYGTESGSGAVGSRVPTGQTRSRVLRVAGKSLIDHQRVAVHVRAKIVNQVAGQNGRELLLLERMAYRWIYLGP
jgi:hypothetical protein